MATTPTTAFAVPLVQGVLVATGEPVQAVLVPPPKPERSKPVRTGRRRLQLGKLGRSLVQRLKQIQARGGIDITWLPDADQEGMREIARIAFAPRTYMEVEGELLPHVRSSKERYAREVIRSHFRNAGLVPEGEVAWENPKLEALRALVHSHDEMRRRDAMYAKHITRREFRAERRRAQLEGAATQPEASG
jgi:hypothetical protein